MRRALPAGAATLVLAVLAGAVSAWRVEVQPYRVPTELSPGEIAAAWSEIETLAAGPEPVPDPLWRDLVDAEEGEEDAALRAWDQGGGGVPTVVCEDPPELRIPVAPDADWAARDRRAAYQNVSAALDAYPSPRVRLAAARVARGLALRGGVRDMMLGLALTVRALEEGPIEGIDAYLPQPRDVVLLMAREAVCALGRTDRIGARSRQEQLAQPMSGPGGERAWLLPLRLDLEREIRAYKSEWIALIGEMKRAGDDYDALSQAARESRDGVTPKSVMLELLWPSAPSAVLHVVERSTAVHAMSARAERARVVGLMRDGMEARLEWEEAELEREAAERQREQAEFEGSIFSGDWCGTGRMGVR